MSHPFARGALAFEQSELLRQRWGTILGSCPDSRLWSALADNWWCLMKPDVESGVKGGENWLKRWWGAPTDRKLLVTTSATILVCLGIIGIRPAWNWLGHAGRDVPWAEILVASAGAASTPASSQPSVPPSVPPTAPAGSSGALPSGESPAAPAVAPPGGTSAVPEPASTTFVLPVPQASPPALKAEAMLFGDQLQALSSLYEALITVLAVGLGLLAAIGFAAIRFASMREAESMARSVFNGSDHRAFVAEEIAKAVQKQWKEIASDFNDLQDRVDALEQSDETVGPRVSVTPPNEQASPPPAPSPTAGPQPSEAAPGTGGNAQAASSTGTETQPQPQPTPLPVPPIPPANAGAVESADTGEEAAAQKSEVVADPAAPTSEANNAELKESDAAPEPDRKPGAGD